MVQFFVFTLLFISLLISSLWSGQWWGIFPLSYCPLRHCLQFELKPEPFLPDESTCCVREGGCQQCMHENDWHFSDTLLGSDWLCWSGSGGFLQIKSQPLDALTHCFKVDLYLILLLDHDDNFSKYNKKIVTDYRFNASIVMSISDAPQQLSWYSMWPIQTPCRGTTVKPDPRSLGACHRPASIISPASPQREVNNFFPYQLDLQFHQSFF